MFNLHVPYTDTLLSRCHIICEAIATGVVHWMNKRMPTTPKEKLALRQFCGITVGAMKRFSTIPIVAELWEKVSQWFILLDEKNDGWFNMERLFILDDIPAKIDEFQKLLEVFDADQHLIALDQVLYQVQV